MHPQFHHRRDSGSYVPIPSGDGIGGGITAGGENTDTNFVYNTAGGTVQASAPPFQVGGGGITQTLPPAANPSAPPTQTPGNDTSGASQSNSSKFPMSAVIGACVGAFVGAGLLICLSVWCYRRSTRKPTRRHVRRSTWGKLGPEEDTWESKTSHAPPMQQVAEKGGLSKTPSQRTLQKLPSQQQLARSFTPVDKVDNSPNAAPFSSYHPGLAAELSEPPKAYIKRQDWDESAASVNQDDSFLSIRSVRVESGTISPAKMTPPETSSSIHRWSIAEVVNPGGSPISPAVNPFLDNNGSRSSFGNPFFGAQEAASKPRRPSVGRKPAPSADPFVDPMTSVEEFEPIPAVSHDKSDSMGSISSTASGTDRAMQSLINALNLPQEEIERRLRIASMQPSEMSRQSARYSVITGESLYGRDSVDVSSAVEDHRQR